MLKSRRMELMCGTARVKHSTFRFTIVSFLLAVYSPPGRLLKRKSCVLFQFHLLSLSRWSPHLPQCQSTSVSVALISIIGGSCHKYHFCRDTRVCREKSMSFVVTNSFCRDKNIMSRQTKFFFSASILLSQHKNGTCGSSRQ